MYLTKRNIMDKLEKFLKSQQETYSQNNTYDIYPCRYISENISDLSIDENIFYSMIRNYRNYKLNYSQGKCYQDLNTICYTSCNRNNEMFNYILLNRENISYGEQDLLVNNKKYINIDLFVNKKDYNIEENYEVLTVHINQNLKIYFEEVGGKNQIRIQLSLEKGIPNTYFEEYLKEIDQIIRNFIDLNTSNKH